MDIIRVTVLGTTAKLIVVNEFFHDIALLAPFVKVVTSYFIHSTGRSWNSVGSVLFLLNMLYVFFRGNLIDFHCLSYLVLIVES